MDILFLCNKPNEGNDANTIVDHIDAFKHYSAHKIWVLSKRGRLPANLNLNQFDAIIIHYSLSLLFNTYLSQSAKTAIRHFQGLKVFFVQDEYRSINRLIDEINFLNIDVMFTCFPNQEIEKIYPQDKLPNVSKYNNLTGYIPERLLTINNIPALENRPIDVGYRARKLPYWYGELGFEKWDIVEQWYKNVNDPKIKTNLSYHEDDRLYGQNWINFLLSCRATLGVESGASVMDFTGQLEKKVEWFQLKHPTASFNEVHDLFLKEHEGKYHLNQISPRCFEAIALKTALILYEGAYSGILIPGRHYIPLKKDFSNIDEVLLALNNTDYLTGLVNTAYTDIALNPAWHYKTWIKQVDVIMDNEFKRRNKAHVHSPFQEQQYINVLRRTALEQWPYHLMINLYDNLPKSLRLTVRSFYRLTRNRLRRQRQ